MLHQQPAQRKFLCKSIAGTSAVHDGLIQQTASRIQQEACGQHGMNPS